MKHRFHFFYLLVFSFTFFLFRSISSYGQLINVDASWGQGGVRTIDFGSTYEGYETAVRQPDGKFLLVGSVDQTSANSKISIARVLANGQIDNSFGQNGKLLFTYDDQNRHLPRQILAMPDGKIYLSFLLSNNTESRRVLVRFLPNGQVDNTFGNQGFYLSPFLTSESWGPFKVMADGKIQCYGTNGEVYDGAFYARLVSFRLFSNGKPDTTYSGYQYRKHMLGPDGWFREGVFWMATTPQGGDVLYCTRQNAINNAITRFILKLKPDGTRDSTFNANGLFSYNFAGTATNTTGLKIDPNNGRILMPGIFRLNNTEIQNPAIYAIKPNGGIDSSYGTNGIARLPISPDLGFNNYLATDLTFDAQGRSYIAFAGKLESVTSITFAAARFLAAGQPDVSYGIGGSIVSSVAGTPNKIFLDQDLLPIVAGQTNLSTIASGVDMALVKLKPDQTTAITGDVSPVEVYPTLVQKGNLVRLPASMQSGAWLVSLQGQKWEVQTHPLEGSENAFFIWPASAPGIYLLQHPSLKRPIRLVAQ